MTIKVGALVSHPDHRLPVRIISLDGDSVVMVVSLKGGGCYRTHTTLAEFTPREAF